MPRSVGQVRLTTIIVLVTVVLAAWSVYPVLRLQYQHERERQSLAAELENLKVRNEELRAQVDVLQTPEGIEEIARESLGLVKPGEQAYVVTGGTIGETTATAGSDESGKKPLWQRVLDSVFGFD